jgi:hypothetical protein
VLVKAFAFTNFLRRIEEHESARESLSFSAKFVAAECGD